MIAFGFVAFLAASCGGTAVSGGPSASVTPSATAVPSESLAPSVSAVASPPASPAGGPTFPWPAPSNPLELTVAAGLVPQPKELFFNHSHAHLDVFIDGQAIVVPAGIGINIEDPGVRHFQNPIGYGGIGLCDRPCISPLHTHDETGMLHTESVDPAPNTLGQFFTEWGVELSETCVGEYCAPTTPIAVYIGGELYDGDPRAIELTDQKVIVIVVGTPPAVIPSTADFSRA